MFQNNKLHSAEKIAVIMFVRVVAKEGIRQLLL